MTNGRVGETNGDGAEGTGVELWMSLHDIEGALRGERVVMIADAGYNLTFFGVRIGGDSEVWAINGRMDGFGGRCAWGMDGVGLNLGVGEASRDGGWIHKRNGGGTELCLGRDDLDAVAEDGGVGFNGGRHVVLVWKYW